MNELNPIQKLQKLLGHKPQETTVALTHAEIEKIKKDAYEKGKFEKTRKAKGSDGISLEESRKREDGKTNRAPQSSNPEKAPLTTSAAPTPAQIARVGGGIVGIVKNLNEGKVAEAQNQAADLVTDIVPFAKDVTAGQSRLEKTKGVSVAASGTLALFLSPLGLSRLAPLPAKDVGMDSSHKPLPASQPEPSVGAKAEVTMPRSNPDYIGGAHPCSRSGNVDSLGRRCGGRASSVRPGGRP